MATGLGPIGIFQGQNTCHDIDFDGLENNSKNHNNTNYVPLGVRLDLREVL